MKKTLKTLAAATVFSLVLTVFAFADVSGAGMLGLIGLAIAFYVAIAAVIVIAIAFVIKLIIKMVRNKK